MRARVKPFNTYGHGEGGKSAGEIVDVDPEEIARVPWCLEAIPDEPPEPPEPLPIPAEEPAPETPKEETPTGDPDERTSNATVSRRQSYPAKLDRKR